jgi:hypothetical protein
MKAGWFANIVKKFDHSRPVDLILLEIVIFLKIAVIWISKSPKITSS